MDINELKAYIEKARSQKITDQEIQDRLVKSGWDAVDVRMALGGEPISPPVPPAKTEGRNQPAQPIAVVQNLSTRGFEYNIMFITLWISAMALAALLHQTADNALNKGNGSYLYIGGMFSITALLVCLPIFAFMFSRLKKAESTDENVRKDPSRKKMVQLTLLVTFLIGVGNIIYFVYTMLSPTDTSSTYNYYYDQLGPSKFTIFVHMLITVGVAGGIFAYYWIDEHKKS